MFNKLTSNFKNQTKKQHQIPAPFEATPQAIEAISKTINDVLAKEILPTLPNTEENFPETETLIRYWGAKRRVTSLLSSINQGDRYYDYTRLENEMDVKNLRVEKDLFAIWLAIHKRPRFILEIGTRTGNSISCLHFLHPDSSAAATFLIDPFNDPPRLGSPEIVSTNLKTLGIDIQNFHFLPGFSQDIFPLFIQNFPDLKFDYILVDGSHTYEDALHDLHMVAPYVAKGGYISMDDTTAKSLRVYEAWKDWQAAQDGFIFKEYSDNYGFAVAMKE